MYKTIKRQTIIFFTVLLSTGNYAHATQIERIKYSKKVYSKKAYIQLYNDYLAHKKMSDSEFHEDLYEKISQRKSEAKEALLNQDIQLSIIEKKQLNKIILLNDEEILKTVKNIDHEKFLDLELKTLNEIYPSVQKESSDNYSRTIPSQDSPKAEATIGPLGYVIWGIFYPFMYLILKLQIWSENS